MQRKLKYFSKVIATTFLFVMVSSGAYAAPYVWPGLAPCNTTLQNCIDNVGSGDTVEIATNTVDESITLDKSLTLKPAAGYSPRFINTHTIVASSTGSTDNSITIQGIVMETGVIIVSHTSSGTFSLNLLDNTIERSFSYGQAIRFWPISGGKTFFNISSNNITVPSGDQMYGIQLHSQSDIEGNISNNVIVMEGATQGNAIEVTNLGISAIVDIIGNTISGTNMDNGIFVYQYTAGSTTDMRIANNLITGQAGNVGGPGAITYYINDGHVNLEVVNNTVADNEEGIMLYCDPGTASGKIANNIIANNTSQGLYIDSGVAAAVSNNHNLLYNNVLNSFTPGAGTLYGDPLFVGGGDYRLQPLSAAVNKGDNASVPSGITTDLDGNPRISGPVVDMGAYEYAGLPVPDIKANGSDGPITVLSNQAVSITVSLDPGCLAGHNADWWIAYHKPFGWLSCVYPDWIDGIQRCFEAPLVGFSSFELINSTFPPGDYLFCFVVDENADGNLDITWFDFVWVYVQ